MKIAVLLIILIVIFIVGYIFLDFLESVLIKKIKRRNVDQQIKDVLFEEIGFSFRETAAGKKYLIIDEYKKNKAIKL